LTFSHLQCIFKKYTKALINSICLISNWIF